MKRPKKRLLFLIAAAIALPAVSHADIVFDPSNFVQAVLQVSNDVALVEKFQQEVTNQLAMLKSWGYTQLPGILQSMNLWQQVFSPGSVYTSTAPGSALDTLYPPAPGDYSETTDDSMAAMRQNWDQALRQALIENRTVQNDAVMDLSPTAQRINEYVQQSNSAPGVTAAAQAGNEELATLVAQIQSLEAQEITDGRADVERQAREQAEEAYAQQQCQAVRGAWNSPPPPSGSVVNAFSTLSN